MDASDAALYATLLKEAPGGLAFFDAELRCHRASDGLAALLGRPVRDLQQRRPAECLPEPVATAFETALRTVLAEGEPLDDELVVPVPERTRTRPRRRPRGRSGGARRRRRAGRRAVAERVLACYWMPARGPGGERPGGEPPGVVLAVLDVTERRRAEEVVRRKEQRYRSLVEAGEQVVWVAAASGEAIDDAPEWRAITGQAPDEYAEGGWLSVVHPEDRPRIETIWAGAVEENRVFETNYRIRTKSGAYRHFASGPCRSGRAARSSSGSARTPTSPGSARPRRCAAG
nr:PAS domain-containing protein [Actinomadura sp. CNU-125]